MIKWTQLCKKKKKYIFFRIFDNFVDASIHQSINTTLNVDQVGIPHRGERRNPVSPLILGAQQHFKSNSHILGLEALRLHSCWFGIFLSAPNFSLQWF